MAPSQQESNLTHSFRLATVEDAEVVAAAMRKEDREELLAYSGREPLEALLDAIDSGDPVFTVIINNEPVAFVGCGPIVRTPYSYIWLLGTDTLVRDSRLFLRHSRSSVKTLFELTGAQYFVNHAHSANTVHLRWLEWLGAELQDEVPLGRNGEMFTGFVIKRERYV